MHCSLAKLFRRSFYKRSFIACLLLLLYFYSSFASACDLLLDHADDSQIRLTSINQHKINLAVLAYINLERCKQQLPLLDSSDALAAVAQSHSTAMVTLGFFDHDSPVVGQQTMAQRLKRNAIRYRRAAENIAQQNVYALEHRKFIVRDLDQCRFVYVDNKQAVPAHSYQSIARAVVNSWMLSPGHRKNILNKAFKKVGTAMAVDSNAPFCGDLLFTQNFTD